METFNSLTHYQAGKILKKVMSVIAMTFLANLADSLPLCMQHPISVTPTQPGTQPASESVYLLLGAAYTRPVSLPSRDIDYGTVLAC